MQITFNKGTALAIMRFLRASGTRARVIGERTDILNPDASPGKRWTRRRLDAIDLGLPFSLEGKPITVAVPHRIARVRSQGVSSTVYADGVPNGAFIDLGNGVAISGPELLFVELAQSMHPIEHLMLGHELCGTFGRDAEAPYNAPVAYKVKPATSVAKIARFLDEARSIRGIEAARTSLRFLNDNAWSPTESLIAAFMRLPIDSLGYEMGELELNPRTSLEHLLPGAKETRVPDIMVAGTPIGVNYDGLAHLDLGSIVKAAMDAGMNPGSAQIQKEVDEAVRSVREKALDDVRRNRELAVEGLCVFPILKEDLYVPNGFDQVAGRLVDLLESQTGQTMDRPRKALRSKALCEERYRLMLSLLPGRHERNVKLSKFIEGCKLTDGPMEIREYWIEF